MKAFILLFFVVSMASWAKSKDNTHRNLSELLQEIRDPVFASKNRKEILDFSLRIMKNKLAQELSIPKEKLTQSFTLQQTHSARLIQAPWADLQTQFYLTLHQENYYQRWIRLQKLVKFSDYGKSINQSLMFHWAQHSPADEGRFYSRWHKISITKNAQTRHAKLPYFLISDKIQDLISLEAHVPFEEIFPTKAVSGIHTDTAAFLKNTQSLSRIQRQELAEKMELNYRIFLRAVTNGAKTIASLHFLSGESKRHSTELQVKSYLDRLCLGCSGQLKKEIQIAAMTYVDGQREFIIHDNLSSVRSELCSTLKNKRYLWNAENLGPTPLEILLDDSKMIDYIIFHSLAERNINVITEIISNNPMGLLLLTKSMSLQNKQGLPIGTKLGCVQATIKQDESKLKSAVAEAHLHVEAYIKRVRDLVIKSRFKLRETNSTLEYFVQTNQSATTEAIATFPQGIGWTLKALAELDQDVSRRKKTDAIVTWGGTIAGVALTISGFYAPEGISLLLSTAGFVKSMSAGTYFMIRTGQEKKLFRDMLLSKESGAKLSNANFKKHYTEYKSLKVAFLKEYTQGVVSYVRIYKTAVTAAGGNLEKAASVIKKLIKISKAVGKDIAEEKMQEKVIELATQD